MAKGSDDNEMANFGQLEQSNEINVIKFFNRHDLTSKKGSNYKQNLNIQPNEVY